MSSTLPNFLFVGAARSGSSSLFKYMKQHPDIFMPERKELRYLVSDFYPTIDPQEPICEHLQKTTVFDYNEYLTHFSNASQFKAIGESSVVYLYFHKTVIPRILDLLGDVKIIMILRNPVERAYSAYSYMISRNIENLSFEESLKVELERMEKVWAPMRYYFHFGLYYAQVKAYIDNFSQVKVCLHDELKNDPQKMMKEVFEFLEVDTDYLPDVSIRHNISGKPVNKTLHQAVMGQNIVYKLLRPAARLLIPQRKRRQIVQRLRAGNLSKSKASDGIRRTLRERYLCDIQMLETLLGKDLSAWK